ncbi:MAG TPA: ParA family protein [Rhizomicrobium sp.]|nr:ParA family protein [Rhizomicrobium sp.]
MSDLDSFTPPANGRMYVLVLASQKGGSGKTTLSGHLAVEADKAGIGPVALIDTDPQGSLAQWWNARAASTPHFAQVGVLELGDALAHLEKSGVKLVVIDTPPAITGSISRVVAHADLVLVPTRPSPHDLRAVGATVDIAEKYSKPLVFVVNGATARARITGEAAVALSQHGTVAPVTLHHRVDFAASMTDGRTVGEAAPKSQSTKEIHDLWVYVQDRLSRLSQDPKITPEARPQHFAVSALSASNVESPSDAEEIDSDFEPERPEPEWVPPAMTENAPLPSLAARPANDVLVPSQEKPPFPDGVDRRSGLPDRRAPQPHMFGSGDRRTHSFGRRATDRTPTFENGGNR